MKLPRQIYSDFPSKLTDSNYIFRLLWICCSGFILIIFYAFESGSGFSGTVSLEAYIIWFTLGIFFFINYLTHNSNYYVQILAFLALLSCCIDIWLSIRAHQNYPLYFHSMIILTIYSFVTFAMALFQSTILSKKS